MGHHHMDETTAKRSWAGDDVQFQQGLNRFSLQETDKFRVKPEAGFMFLAQAKQDASQGEKLIGLGGIQG
jgi:hypothetical protein